MPYRKMKNSQRNCLTSSNMATAWHHLTCSTVARKGLEEHRSASIRNSETPQQDKPCQNSPPYRTGMEWRRRWPHGLGPKHPKHGFFGALPLGQRGVGGHILTYFIFSFLTKFPVGCHHRKASWVWRVPIASAAWLRLISQMHKALPSSSRCQQNGHEALGKIKGLWVGVFHCKKM